MVGLNGKRTVWADAASHGLERRRRLADEMAPWAATLAAMDGADAGECVRQLKRLGAAWDDLLERGPALWDAQRAAYRLEDPEVLPHVSTVYGRAAGAPMVDPAHALLVVHAGAGVRRSRVVELADLAYGMTPLEASGAENETETEPLPF
jgi:hypothetical protein